MHSQAVRRTGAPLLRALDRRNTRAARAHARRLAPRRAPTIADGLACLAVAAVLVLFGLGVLAWGSGVASWPVWGGA